MAISHATPNYCNHTERSRSPGGHQPLCPFFHTPFDDCYCIGITSFKVPLLLHYCGDHHLECSIYQKRRKTMEGDKR